MRRHSQLDDQSDRYERLISKEFHIDNIKQDYRNNYFTTSLFPRPLHPNTGNLFSSFSPKKNSWDTQNAFSKNCGNPVSLLSTAGRLIRKPLKRYQTRLGKILKQVHRLGCLIRGAPKSGKVFFNFFLGWKNSLGHPASSSRNLSRATDPLLLTT